MDPLSHAVFGACAGAAASGRRIPRAALAAGALAAAFPDIDVLINSPDDPLLFWIHHRGFTHSLFLAPVIGVLCAAPLLLWKPLRAQWRWVLLAGVAGAASHGLMDAFTSYGTVWFWPFSDARVAWDALPIIDLVLTPVLLAGVLAAAWRKSAWPAAAALAFFGFYAGLGVVQRERALAWQAQLAEARGDVVERGRAMPAPGSLLVWRSVYRTPEGEAQADGLRLPYWGRATAIPGERAPIAQRADFPESDEADRAFEVFQWFADGFGIAPHGTERVLGDGRYAFGGGSMTPLWGIRFAESGDRIERWRPGTRADLAQGVWDAKTGRDGALMGAREAVEAVRRGSAATSRSPTTDSVPSGAPESPGA